MLAGLDEWVLRPRPDLFHFNCGLHEIRRFRPGDPQTVPLAGVQYGTLKKSSGGSERTPKRAITWAHTTPIFHERRDKLNTYGRLETDVVEYNAAASEVAGKYGVRVVDLHRLTHESGMEQIHGAERSALHAGGIRLAGAEPSRRPSVRS